MRSPVETHLLDFGLLQCDNPVIFSLCALFLAACQSSSNQSASLGNQPRLDVPAGAQSVNIAADPGTVRAALVSSARERGTAVLQDQPNMVILERPMAGENPTLWTANSVLRTMATGSFAFACALPETQCQTLAVQDLAVINNVRTALEQSFVLPGNPNTMQSLQGLKSRAEQSSSCPSVGILTGQTANSPCIGIIELPAPDGLAAIDSLLRSHGNGFRSKLGKKTPRLAGSA